MEELTQFQVMIDAILWALEEGRTKIGSPVPWSQEGVGYIMVTNMMHMPQPMIVAGITPANPNIYELIVQWLRVQPYIVRVHRTTNALLAQFSH
jgi:hypothetical protein